MGVVWARRPWACGGRVRCEVSVCAWWACVLAGCRGRGARGRVEQVLRDRNRTLEVRWIRDLLHLVLHKNNFEFNGNHFLQTGGTAMGTRVAPSLANIFMGKIEKELLQKWDHQPMIWWRFIDDIFCIWTHGQRELAKFLDHLNKSHHTIKFTMEASTEKVNYLDTTVHNKGGKLEVSLYTKPTDTHSYLHYTSCHTKPCKEGGPYGQFLRMKRNNTNQADYEDTSQQLIHHYRRRGYPTDILQTNKEKADTRDRQDVLNPKKDTTNKTNGVPFITTFNPGSPDIRKIIMKHWPLLQHSERAHQLYNKPPLFGYRHCSNLKDSLVRAKIRFPKPHAGKQGKVLRNPPQTCERTNCSICKKMERSEITTSTVTEAYHMQGQQGSTDSVL